MRDFREPTLGEEMDAWGCMNHAGAPVDPAARGSGLCSACVHRLHAESRAKGRGMFYGSACPCDACYQARWAAPRSDRR